MERGRIFFLNFSLTVKVAARIDTGGYRLNSRTMTKDFNLSHNVVDRMTLTHSVATRVKVEIVNDAEPDAVSGSMRRKIKVPVAVAGDNLSSLP